MSLRLHLICIKQYRLLRGVVTFWKQNHVRMMCSVCKDWLKGESMGCVQSFALTRVFFPGQVGSISKIEKGIWRTKRIQIAIQDFRIDVGSGLGYRWFDYILCSTMTMISVYFKSICCMTILHILRDPYHAPPPFLLSAHTDLHLWTFQGCGLLTSIPPWWCWRATAKRPWQEGPGWILICRTWSEVVSPHCQPPHLPHHQTALCVWQVSGNIATLNPQFFTEFLAVCQVPTMSDFAGLSSAFPRYTQCRLAGVRGIICSWRALLNPQITLRALWRGRWDWVLIP